VRVSGGETVFDFHCICNSYMAFLVTSRWLLPKYRDQLVKRGWHDGSLAKQTSSENTEHSTKLPWYTVGQRGVGRVVK
jgi:hypothetical protein